MPTNKGFVLAARPQGEAKESDFRFFTKETSEPADGQVLVKNLWMSLDPYMRGRMDESKSYAANQKLDDVMIAGTAGEVVASKNKDFVVGDQVVSNNGGWQWAASTGCDAQPWFRIFNPVTQSQKFDPKGEYIATWVPELRHLDAKGRHEPWTVSGTLDADAPAYPAPIVDLKASRQEALDAYQRMRG